MTIRNKVPIVFSFDDNMCLPACVCLTSLLESAKSTTFYSIYILCNDSLGDDSRIRLSSITNHFLNASVSFVECGNIFESAFTIRGINQLAYFRLKIPSLLPDYDKIIYSDVDVIFKEDLSDLYRNINLEHNLLAGVRASFTSKSELKYLDKLGIKHYSYINSGFLVFNSSLLRKEQIEKKFVDEVKNKYYYQDQDIVNIVCNGRIKFLPLRYTFVQKNYLLSYDYDLLNCLYSQEELDTARKVGIVHYNGPKPWNCLCPRYDMWWSVYRSSVFYNEEEALQMERRILSSAVPKKSLIQRIKSIYYRYF